MENRTNQIMTLDNNRDYFINRQILYKGINYYVATLLKEELDAEGNAQPEDEIIIFEEREKDGEKILRVLEDKDVAKAILENI